MYLKEDAIVKMFKEISDLSAPGSLVLVNTMNTVNHHSSDFTIKHFKEHGWTQEETVMFGDSKFNFGKFPEGVEPSKLFGFASLRK